MLQNYLVTICWKSMKINEIRLNSKKYLNSNKLQENKQLNNKINMPPSMQLNKNRIN